jgi:2-methylcitrate dehydratase PrpD
LSERETSIAIGLAVGFSSGVRGAFGAPLKPLQLGQAAANGVLATELAKAGMAGHTDMIERKDGFLDVMGCGGFDPAALDPPAHLAIQRVMFKRHAACFLTHAALEAARTMVLERRLEATRISRVMIHGCEDLKSVCNRPTLSTPLDAKFSAQFVVAAAIAGYETASLGLYEQPPTADPAIAMLMPRISLQQEARFNQDTSRVEIVLTDGERLELTVMMGEPPANGAAEKAGVVAKARSLLTPVYGAERANGLIEQVEMFGRHSLASDLMASFASE